MTTTLGRPDDRDLELPEDSPTRAIVYVVAAIGLAVSLVALMFSGAEFGIATIALALLATLPYLLYARLAIARPGAEAVVAGVLLLAVGAWGSIEAIDEAAGGDLVLLPFALVVMQLVVFVVGAVLRGVVPARRAR